MRDIVELVSGLTAAGWKILCAASVLCLGLLMLDRRGERRPARQVRRVEDSRDRRAA